MEEIELWKDCFICWFDFLGYKGIMEEAEIILSLVELIEDLIEDTLKELHLSSFFRILTVSDTVIIVWKKINDPTADLTLLKLITDIMSLFQFSLLSEKRYLFALIRKYETKKCGENAIPIRGIITSGDAGFLIRKNKILLIGNGIKKAAEREQKIEAPLIHIDEELVELFKQDGTLSNIVYETTDKDSKSVLAINYLRALQFLDNSMCPSELAEIHKEFIEEQLSINRNEKVLRKYRKLIPMHNEFVGLNSLSAEFKVCFDSQLVTKGQDVPAQKEFRY